jgi:hypothetical protein
MEWHVYSWTGFSELVLYNPRKGIGLVQCRHHHSSLKCNLFLPQIAEKLFTCRLRNKSWKPECVVSFNMGWWILVFYLKFTNIWQPMLKLKTHSGFHDLFRFWYVQEYKYGSILWLEDGNLYLHLRKMSHTIYAANRKVSHIHWRMCEWDYTIDKKLVCLQSEKGGHVRKNNNRSLTPNVRKLFPQVVMVIWLCAS